MSQETLTLVLLWVHVPFAVGWIGVAILDAFLAVAPGLTAQQRASLIRPSLPFTYLAIPVILLTGIWQTVYNPVTAPMWSLQILEELKKSTYGWALFYKHVFVLGTLVATLAIKLSLARQIGSPAPLAATGGSATRAALPSTGSGALRVGTWLNLAACVGILICVVLMVWQLH